MKKLRLLAAVTCLSLVLGSAAGCGKKANNTIAEDDASSQVQLKWVLGGLGQLKDSQTVWEEFNKKLSDYLPNTTVSFEVIPYSDYAEKWRLMSASKEQTDLVWVGWMLNLYEEAQKGSLMALDDLISLTPDLIAELPDYLLDLGKINGKLYCIPNYQIMTQLPYGTKTQKELADQYLDADAVTATFNKQEAPTKDDYKIFEDYLAKLQEAGKLNKGVAPSFLDHIVARIGGLGNFSENIVANAVIDWRDPDLKVYDELTDFPDKEAYYEIVNDWFKKGYIRKDILSLQDTSADENKENGYVLWSHSVFKGDSETSTKKYGFPILSIPTFQDLYIPSTRPSTNTGISKTTVNAQRSMKLIELMNTKKGSELYNMLVFGLEGTHYNKQEGNLIEWLGESAPGNSSDNAYGYNNWAFGNIFNSYETQYDTVGWNDYVLHEVNETATASPLIGFTLDTENIKLEIAQFNAIKKEYDYVDYGTNDNWRELLNERNEKLKKAGSDKIVEEVRRQVEEWKKVK